MRILDLTHPLSDSVPVYFAWHPKTELVKTANYRDHRCEVTRVSVGTHTGTHIDAPSHVFEGAPRIDQYDPKLWVKEAQVLDFTPREPRKEITRAELQGKLKRKGLGVVIKTGWDVHFGKEDYYKTYPPLSAEGAEFLVEMEVPILAADTPYTLDVHYICLRKGIPLVTNINHTSQLQEGMIKLIAAPLLIRDGDGAPARVLAILE
ncbi:MAG: cyclase family protein [Bacteroidota bacterium]